MELARAERKAGPVLTRGYRWAVAGAGLAVPMLALWYLLATPQANVRLESHGIHVVIITAGNALAVLTAYVAWRNFVDSGEPTLRYFALGFLGFALVYVWHGFLTSIGPAALFLAYGAPARLLLALYSAVALVVWRRAAEPLAQRSRSWLPHVGAFIAVDAALAAAIYAGADVRWSRAFDFGSLVLFPILAIMLLSREGSRLHAGIALAFVLFAQASGIFLLSRPWDVIWWLAHATFASGFLLLGLAMVRSFETTRSVRTVFSEPELFRQVQEHAAQLEAKNAELEESNRALREMNESLNAFSYVVSHDLKEPVRAINAYSEALKEDTADGTLRAEARALVERNLESSRRLARLVDGLLEFSRGAQHRPQDARAMTVEQALRSEECLARFDDLARERGATVEARPGPPFVAARPAIAQILGNLVLNAVKHNPSRTPHVRVTSSPRLEDPAFVEIIVEDDGPGFPQQVADQFRQLNPKRPSTIRGGFGLLITRRAVEQLGGRMWVDRSPDLGGAAVHITVPAASAKAGTV